MTMNVSLAPDELLESSPEDQAVLCALIGDQAVDAAPERVSVPVGKGDFVVCELGHPDLWMVLDSREGELRSALPDGAWPGL